MRTIARYFQISRSIFLATSNESIRMASADLRNASLSAGFGLAGSVAARGRAAGASRGRLGARRAGSRGGVAEGVGPRGSASAPLDILVCDAGASGRHALGDLVHHFVAISRVADDLGQIKGALPFEPGGTDQDVRIVAPLGRGSGFASPSRAADSFKNLAALQTAWRR